MLFLACSALRRAALLFLLSFALAGSAAGASFTVTNANNAGSGSLRDAITQANASAGTDTITFAAALDGAIIALDSTLSVGAGGITVDASALALGLTISGKDAARIFNVASGSSLALNRLRLVRGNAGSGNNGGAIQSDGSPLTLTDCTFADNAAGNAGGAIYLSGSAAALNATGCTFDRNVAGDSGAIVILAPGTSSFANCTFTANRGTDPAGTGAISALGTAVSFTHCTIFANAGGTFGGGLFVSTSLTLNRCLLAANTADGVSPDLYRAGGNINVAGSANFLGNNGNALSGGVAATFPAGTLVGTPGAPLDPRLRPLGPSGGQTWTLAPLTGSPAIDAGGSTSPLATDQRGLARVVGAQCDLGAVERGPLLAQVTTTADDGSANSLRARLASVTQADSRIQFAPALSGQTITLNGTSLPTGGRIADIDASTLPGGLTISANNASPVGVNSNGALALNRLTLTAGNSGNSGGGLYLTTAALLAVDCTFSNHTSAFFGGAVNVTRGEAAILRSTFVGNSARDGAAMVADSCPRVRLTNCTVSGNQAGSVGAGGVVIQGVSSADLVHVTATGNVGSRGGGVVLLPSSATRVERCLFAGNSDRENDASPDLYLDGGATLIKAGPSLIGNNGSDRAGAVDGFYQQFPINGFPLFPVDARLGPLARSGGFTATHLPLAGSLALDNAGVSSVLTDQRGLPRGVGAGSDLGAVERGPFVSVTSPDDAGAGTLRAALLAGAPDTTAVFGDSFDGRPIILASPLAVPANAIFTIDGSARFTGIILSGGGATQILNVAANATLALNRVRLVRGNSSTGGGAINGDAGTTLALVDCTFLDNSGGPSGGAINTSGVIAATACTFERNTANDGGALYLFRVANNSFANCTFTANRATGFNKTGAVVLDGGTAAFTHCTFFANAGGNASGGLFLNANARLTLNRCLIAGNTATDSVSPDIYQSGGTIDVAGSNNLIGNNGSGALGGVAATFPAGLRAGTPAAPLDPLLRPIGPSGGRTWTLAPLQGSPAIDAGGTSSPLATDQRGFPRLVGSGCDLGAVERGPLLGAVTTTADDASANSLRTLLSSVTQPDSRILFAPQLSGQTITLNGNPLPSDGKFVDLDASNLPAGVTISANGASRLFVNQRGALAFNRLTLSDGRTSGNFPSGMSGAGFMLKQTLLLAVDCAFTNHSGINKGGAIYASAVEAAFQRTTFSGNYAFSSGALSAEGESRVRLTNCTVSANQSFSDGALSVSESSDADLVHVTVTGNISSFGGGVYCYDGGGLRLERCLIAGNVVRGGDYPPDVRCVGTVPFAVGPNLIGNNGSGLPGSVSSTFPAGALVGTPAAPLDARVGLLLLTGGTTATHSPLAGSPAIDQGGASPLLTDQRGLPRGVGSGSDLGAVERGPFLTVTNAGDAGAGTLRAALAAATARDATVAFDAALDGAVITLASTLPVGAGGVAVDASTLPLGLTLSGGGAMRLFDVASGAGLSLNRLRLLRGSAGASGNGGAIQSAGAPLALADCTFTDNAAGSLGGAIFLSGGGAVSAARCLFERNVAADSGAIYLQGVPASSFANCTFTANRGTGAGATGAITAAASPVSFVHCTIFANVGGSFGGGIYASGTLALTHCIVAANTAVGSASPDVFKSGSATIATAGNASLLGSNGDGNAGSVAADFPAGALAGTPGSPLDPKLRPLGPSGGRTWTLAPMTGSPAIDAGGLKAAPLSTDQRGFPRVVDGYAAPSDLGAVERGPLLAQVTTSADDGSANSLRARLASVTQADSRIQFAPALSGQTITLATGRLPTDGKVVDIDAGTLPAGLVISANNASRFFAHAGGAVALNRLTLSDGNSGNSNGGAAFFQGAALLAVDCAFLNHTSAFLGGAVSVTSGEAAFERVTFANCSALDGGAFLADTNSRLRLTNCTVSANQAGVGGAGGIVSRFGSDLDLVHVTVSGNVGSRGGGVYYQSSSTLRVERSVLAGNVDREGDASPDILNNGSPAPIVVGPSLLGSNGSGLAGSVSSAFPAGALAGTPGAPLSARLAPLDYYGGFTPTHALRPGSPARDAGAGSPIFADQRGQARAGAADLGAYEAGAPYPNYNAYIWELLPASATAAQHGPDFDFDGDGASNYLEYLSATDPTSATSVFRPTVSRSGSLVTVGFPTVSGRTYLLETNPDLAVPNNWTTQNGVVGNGGPVELSVTAGTARLFLRVRVSP